MCEGAEEAEKIAKELKYIPRLLLIEYKEKKQEKEMRDKSFRKQIKQAQKEILDDNREWFDNFVSEHFPESEKKKEPGGFFGRYRAVWLSACACLMAAVIVLVGVAVFLPGGGSQTVPPPNYYNAWGWFPSKSLNLEQLNAGLTEINVDIYGEGVDYGDSEVECGIDEFYDEATGDTLWCMLYLAYGGNDHAWIDIEIYPNPYFANTHKAGEDNISTNLGGLSVIYSEKVEEDDGIFEIDSHAIIERGNTSVYIKYAGWSYRDSGKLLAFIERTIKAI